MRKDKVAIFVSKNFRRMVKIESAKCGKSVIDLSEEWARNYNKSKEKKEGFWFGLN